MGHVLSTGHQGPTWLLDEGMLLMAGPWAMRQEM